MAGVRVRAIEWLRSPSGKEFLEWFEDELELRDTATTAEHYNRHTRNGGPPATIDVSEVLIREGRRQAFNKLELLSEMEMETENVEDSGRDPR